MGKEKLTDMKSADNYDINLCNFMAKYSESTNKVKHNCQELDHSPPSANTNRRSNDSHNSAAVSNIVLSTSCCVCVDMVG
jgi:hypothetical protein